MRTVVNDLQYVPYFRYISVSPALCFCVAFWEREIIGIVIKRSPRLPKMQYVFTSSFIAPTNWKGLSVEQKKEFIHFLLLNLYTIPESLSRIPEKKSPP